MRLELGYVYDIVGVQDRIDDMKAAVQKAFRARHRLVAGIIIEPGGALKRQIAAGLIDVPEVAPPVRPAGAVGNGDVVYAVVAEPADDRRNERRMCRRSLLRPVSSEQIRLMSTMRSARRSSRPPSARNAIDRGAPCVSEYDFVPERI